MSCPWGSGNDPKLPMVRTRRCSKLTLVFDCGFQSEMVNCRLFWQFSGLRGGGGWGGL
jgi:hypothetical protein